MGEPAAKKAKLDAANEDIEKNGVILEEKDDFIKTLIQTPKGKLVRGE